jgi:hypothetical protein
MSHRAPTFIIAAAALIAAGCGGSSNDKPATSAGSAAATQKSQAPYGLYVRTVTKQDVARTASFRDEHGPNQSAPLTGRYRLVIAKGANQDVIKVTDPEGFMIDQDVTVVPGTFRITSYVDPNRASFCGPEAPAQASYAFQASGSSLQLRPHPKDGCADRDSMLTGTWSKG